MLLIKLYIAAIIMTLISLVLFISGLVKSKVTWGHFVLFLLCSFLLPYVVGIVLEKRTGDFDYLAYGTFYSSIIVQTISLIFLFSQLKKN